MSLLARLFGRPTMSEADRAIQNTFVREESAAVWWHENREVAGESADNVEHVGNHELWLEAMTKYNITRQGMLNGYVRAYGRVPYWVTSDDYIGEE